MTNPSLPFFPPDLFEEDRDFILDLVHQVGLSDRFILKERVARLEAAIAEMTGARDVIACSSGTGALALAVHALGIGPGDEVIVPVFCCQPVASTVVDRGARPVFVDVDRRTMVMLPACAREAITPATKAIMPAHVFSVMADMPAIAEIAGRHALRVIEDAAVAQGAVLQGRPAGRWGDVNVFSFFQVKALGTIGEGGVVLTDDPELGRRVRMLRNHGQDGVNRFLHHAVGHNCRMDELQAGFLLHRLGGLEARLARRAEIASYYTRRFAHLGDRGLVTPPAGCDGRCYYVYSVLTPRRSELRHHLASRGVGSHVYYPLTLAEQPAFRAWVPPGRRFPNAEQVSRENLALPIYPHLTDAQVEHIADAVVDFHG